MLKYWHSIGKRHGSIVEKLVNDETFRNIGISKKMNHEVSQQCRDQLLTKLAKSLQIHRKQFQESFTNFWRIRTEKSAKLSHFYFTFKNTLGAEKYLYQGLSPQYRRVLASFRLGNHKLAVETLRFVTPKIPYQNRICSLCPTGVENETHVLTKCTDIRYSNARDSFYTEIESRVPSFRQLTDEDKCFFLMSQEDRDITELLAKFIEEMSRIRSQT